MPDLPDRTAEDARVAAQIEADVGVEHVGNVYASGLLGAAEKAGQTEAVLAEFDDLVANVLTPFPKIEAILASGLISAEEKAGILDRTLGPRASPLFVNFLKIVVRRGRLGCLRAIHHQAHGLYDKLRNRVRVQLTTATPLSDELAGRVVDQLRAALSGEPVLSRRVDPQLIGGAVLRVGDTVHDGSVANQLRRLRQEIIDRSAHEIQSRRDRFRDPAGN